MESDSFVCVRQAVEGGTPEVFIINLKNNNEILKRPIKADSAIMHWTKQIIALKASQRTLQVFDLGQKVKLGSYTMTEDILYWKWITSETIGMVTETSVYHWNALEPNATSPSKVFDRNNNLQVRIILGIINLALIYELSEHPNH